MPGKNSILIIPLVLFILIFSLSTRMGAAQKLFKEIERIELKLDDVVFASISDVVSVSDGFVLIIKESRFGDTYALLKLSKSGEPICKYDKRGNGPGEIRSIDRIAVKKKSILVAESFAPYIHEYSHNLEFIKDHRIKKGGEIILLGKFIGIWSRNFITEDKKDKIYMLALYDKDTLKFQRYAFEVKEVPDFVYTWGGMCKVDNNSYAGVYATTYQIHLFDKNLQHEKRLITIVPKYIKKYYPYKGDPQTFDQTSQKWMESWSKMESIDYVDNKFILGYMQGKNSYFDIIDNVGNILYSQYKVDKKWIVFTDNSHVWWLEKVEDNEDVKYFLIKSRLNLEHYK
ncbi:MAG: hypothetical protein GTO45_09915 [Candidatus Aminicenantes bacterium]|nr:hypothetical protein [Candidatus Aminicenantes bacterium]NIM79124.1 hypothetical protein [Candidatus Aminicenantes bacterium]NIN18409.1 hypothetical protein [Candidatus Aminicenantes bacterium]NIN42297.1 hypothetical protein [Candidatus Aminicenantes bacterium]NIN85063.1 hypothetical protein [Candidatus Aminicenantes bacterium]